MPSFVWFGGAPVADSGVFNDSGIPRARNAPERGFAGKLVLLPQACGLSEPRLVNAQCI